MPMVVPAISWIQSKGPFSVDKIKDIAGLDGCPTGAKDSDDTYHGICDKTGTIVACDDPDALNRISESFSRGNSYVETGAGTLSICGPRSSCQNTDIVVKRGNSFSQTEAGGHSPPTKTVKMAQCLCLSGAP